MKRSILSLLLIGLILLAGLLLTMTVLSPKVTADATAVDAANQLYSAGHYGEAIQLYETQVARGVQDSVLFYNLGNAYFQKGDVGRAVLNLERAAQLNPRDADIANNLALVREPAVHTARLGRISRHTMAESEDHHEQTATHDDTPNTEKEHASLQFVPVNFSCLQTLVGALRAPAGTITLAAASGARSAPYKRNTPYSLALRWQNSCHAFMERERFSRRSPLTL